MGAILMVVLIVLLLGTVPTYPYSRKWGYGPSGGVGLLVIILLVLLLMGNVPWWGYGPDPSGQWRPFAWGREMAPGIRCAGTFPLGGHQDADRHRLLMILCLALGFSWNRVGLRAAQTGTIPEAASRTKRTRLE